MFKHYGIILDKEPGFERFNDDIIRRLEVDGWKASRHLNVRQITISSNRLENCYPKMSDLMKRLGQLLTPKQLERCVIKVL